MAADFIRVRILPGEVLLEMAHRTDCQRNLSTADPDATTVELGCVTAYLINQTAVTDNPETVPWEDDDAP